MMDYHNRVICPVRAAMIVLLVACRWGGEAFATETFPYTGVVQTETVEVRAGGGNSFYVVGTLKQGDLVEVHGHFYGWVKIKPPEGVFSYIKRAFVNRHGDGNVGTVSDEKAMAWAAQVKGPPGASFRQQRFLTEGERVAIIEQKGDYYRILPPSDTYVFLPPDSIVLATEVKVSVVDDHADPAPPPAVTVMPSENADADLMPDEATLATDVAMEPEPVTDDAAGSMPLAATDDASGPVASAADPSVAGDGVESQAVIAPSDVAETVDSTSVHDASGGPAPMVEAAEMRLNAVSELPLGDQPIDELIAAYQHLNDAPDLSRSDRSLVMMRIKQLGNRKRLAATLRSVSAFRSDLKRRPENASEAFEAQMKSGYAAVGRLLASIVYNGETLPVMYRVVEPGTYRTLAYVRPATKAQATRLLGRIVGVVGRSRYDRALKALVVEVDRLELLEPSLQQEAAGGGAEVGVAFAPTSDGS